MITVSVIHRTFHIRYGGATGTAFAVDHADKQYLVTARHVVPDITTGGTIDIFHDKQWKSFAVTVVGIGAGEKNIAVLACPIRLAPPHPLEASSAGLAYGQEVYFLGFPFGWDSGAEDINRDFPMPFVKAGVVSAFTFEEPSRMYIDAHGNKGFSGGPVVFRTMNQAGDDFRVAGIVSQAPRPVLTPVVDKLGEPVRANGAAMAYFAENQGFVLAFDIRHATDMIDANPIGFDLPRDEAS